MFLVCQVNPEHLLTKHAVASFWDELLGPLTFRTRCAKPKSDCMYLNYRKWLVDL